MLDNLTLTIGGTKIFSVLLTVYRIVLLKYRLENRSWQERERLLESFAIRKVWSKISPGPEPLHDILRLNSRKGSKKETASFSALSTDTCEKGAAQSQRTSCREQCKLLQSREFSSTALALGLMSGLAEKIRKG